MSRCASTRTSCSADSQARSPPRPFQSSATSVMKPRNPPRRSTTIDDALIASPTIDSRNSVKSGSRPSPAAPMWITTPSMPDSRTPSRSRSSPTATIEACVIPTPAATPIERPRPPGRWLGRRGQGDARSKAASVRRNAWGDRPDSNRLPPDPQSGVSTASTSATVDEEGVEPPASSLSWRRSTADLLVALSR